MTRSVMNDTPTIFFQHHFILVAQLSIRTKKQAPTLTASIVPIAAQQIVNNVFIFRYFLFILHAFQNHV